MEHYKEISSSSVVSTVMSVYNVTRTADFVYWFVDGIISLLNHPTQKNIEYNNQCLYYLDSNIITGYLYQA
jgi:hypothetical protein